MWAGRASSLNLCNDCLINSIKNVSEKRNLFLAESGFIEVLLPVLSYLSEIKTPNPNL